MLNIRTAAGVSTVIVELEGNIYSNIASAFEQDLRKAASRTIKHIILDGTKLKQIDSSGLNVLITIIKYLKANQKGDLILFGVQDVVLNVIQLCKLDKFIKIVSNEQEALELAKN